MIKAFVHFFPPLSIRNCFLSQFGKRTLNFKKRNFGKELWEKNFGKRTFGKEHELSMIARKLYGSELSGNLCFRNPNLGKQHGISVIARILT